MRLEVKANIPLNIRMCLECPFYSTKWFVGKDAVTDTCSAEQFLPDGSKTRIILNPEDTKVILDSCPLLRYEKKK